MVSFALSLNRLSYIFKSFNISALPTLSETPSAKSTGVRSVTIQWDAWNPDIDIGDGPIVAYNVYASESRTTPTTSIPANMGLVVSTYVPNLSPDTHYIFCIKVERVGAGGEGPCSNVSFTTLSIVPGATTSTEKTETFAAGTGGMAEITSMPTPPTGSI